MQMQALTERARGCLTMIQRLAGPIFNGLNLSQSDLWVRKVPCEPLRHNVSPINLQ